MTPSVSLSKDEKKKQSTYANEPLDTSKSIKGNSRKPSDAPSEIQQKCIDIVIDEGRRRQLSIRDISYYIAIAKRESGFNPDAANINSTASGIAQMQVDTGKKYGIDDTNRFDARASIRAGLDFYLDIKQRLKRDYGRVDGEYEPLIYFLYHYGEFYHYRDRKYAKDPYTLGEIIERYKAKYEDSTAVVHQAVAFEKILNGSHALQIQLRDVMGKPMTERKVLVLVPKQKKTSQPKSVTVPLAEAASSSAPTSSDKALTGNQSAEENYASASPSIESAALSQDKLADEEGNMNLEAKVYTTDAEGNIPAIETSNEQPLLVLIPRPNYEEYTEAVIKGDILEGNQPHEILPRDDVAMYDALPTIQGNVSDSVEKKPIEIENVPSVSIQSPVIPPQGISGASTIPANNSRPVNATPQKQNKLTAAEVAASAPKVELNWSDVKKACDSIGWACVRSGFVYAKQFVTKPKLPETPFAEGKPKPGDVRVQSIASSLKATQVKSFSKQSSLVTEEKTADKDLKADDVTPWMDIALSEQGKKFQEIKGRYQEDAKWKELDAERKNLAKGNDKLKKDLAIRNKQKLSDTSTTATIHQEIETNNKRIEEIRLEQEKIIPQYEEIEILKYFSATGFKNPNDETAWCSAFVNWALKQAGYKHTKEALASSWISYGVDCSPPKYGAIIVVQQTKKGQSEAESTSGFHVGFFVGQSEQKNKKKKSDGSIEVETLTKWRILGGNQGQFGKITETNFLSSTYRLKALRWPIK